MKLSILGHAVAILGVAAAAPAMAADIPSVKRGVSEANAAFDGPTITVGGDAEETVKPTLAILSLAAVDEMPTAAAAAARNAKVAADVVSAVKKLGVADEDIRPGDLQLEPQFKDVTDPKTQEVVERRFLGYRAGTMYRVRLHDVEKAAEIARKFIENGSNAYRGLDYVADEDDDRLDALRAKAIANAKRRAEIYAREASLRLGEIVQIAPGGVNYGSNPERTEAKGAWDPLVAFSLPLTPSIKPMRASVKVTWSLLPPNAEGCAAPAEKP